MRQYLLPEYRGLNNEDRFATQVGIPMALFGGMLVFVLGAVGVYLNYDGLLLGVQNTIAELIRVDNIVQAMIPGKETFVIYGGLGFIVLLILYAGIDLLVSRSR